MVVRCVRVGDGGRKIVGPYRLKTLGELVLDILDDAVIQIAVLSFCDDKAVGPERTLVLMAQRAIIEAFDRLALIDDIFTGTVLAEKNVDYEIVLDRYIVRSVLENLVRNAINLAFVTHMTYLHAIVAGIIDAECAVHMRSRCR